jgi:hypothetical protein
MAYYPILTHICKLVWTSDKFVQMNPTKMLQICFDNIVKLFNPNYVCTYVLWTKE